MCLPSWPCCAAPSSGPCRLWGRPGLSPPGAAVSWRSASHCRWPHQALPVICPPGPGCCRWVRWRCSIRSTHGATRLSSRRRTAPCGAWRGWCACPRPPACSKRAAASATACANCMPSTRAHASMGWSGAGRCALPASGAAALHRSSAATCGRPGGRAISWSTCSSGPRACRVQSTRLRANSRPEPGSPAWNSRRCSWNPTPVTPAPTGAGCGCTSSPSRRGARRFQERTAVAEVTPGWHARRQAFKISSIVMRRG